LLTSWHPQQALGSEGAGGWQGNREEKREKSGSAAGCVLTIKPVNMIAT